VALPGGRKHFKIKKALKKAQEREEEDEGGRKSRSKRFNNPEFEFGKKSLVYQLNKGDLKDRITKLVDARRARLQGITPEENPTKKTERRDAWASLDAASSESQLSSGRRRMRDHRRRDQASEESRRVREELGEDEHRQTSASRQRDRKAISLPTTIPYTTAASQFLFGRWPVTAALREGKRKLYHLYVYESSTKQGVIDGVRALAEKRGIRVTVVPEANQKLLDSMSKGRPHNGLVLEASPLPQLPIESLGPVDGSGYTVDVARQSKEDLEINGCEPFQRWNTRSGHKPLILLLHEIMDPGNLGAIMRTARFLGAAAVAITKGTSSPVTTTVVKAAAGAAEEMAIFSVADPVSFLENSRDAGWDSYVAVAPTSSRSSRTQSTLEDVVRDDPLRQKPCILVLGNEGEGLSRKIISRATHQVTISRQPTLVTSSVDSLNVSVAAALLCDAFTKGMRSVPQSFQEMLKQDAKKAESGESLF